MRKIILALMVVCASVFADRFVGVEVATGKSYSDSTAKINSGIVKLGYEGEAARLFVFGGMDHYNNHEGSAKYYGVEFDKKFEDMFLGLGIGFGKKNMKGYELTSRDLIFKVGHTFSNSVEAGVKFVDRSYSNTDVRNRLGLIFVGYNFNL